MTDTEKPIKDMTAIELYQVLRRIEPTTLRLQVGVSIMMNALSHLRAEDDELCRTEILKLFQNLVRFCKEGMVPEND